MSPPAGSPASSPEFEFRRLSSADELPSAAELFHDGFILPLNRLPHPPLPRPNESSLPSSPSSSKRWRNLFRPPEPTIKLWPFSRSRSAGAAAAAKDAAADRKRISSAPSSRSGSSRERGRGKKCRVGEVRQRRQFSLKEFFARKLYIREYISSLYSASASM